VQDKVVDVRREVDERYDLEAGERERAVEEMRVSVRKGEGERERMMEGGGRDGDGDETTSPVERRGKADHKHLERERGRISKNSKK